MGQPSACELCVTRKRRAAKNTARCKKFCYWIIMVVSIFVADTFICTCTVLPLPFFSVPYATNWTDDPVADDRTYEPLAFVNVEFEPAAFESEPIFKPVNEFPPPARDLGLR